MGPGIVTRFILCQNLRVIPIEQEILACCTIALQLYMCHSSSAAAAAAVAAAKGDDDIVKQQMVQKHSCQQTLVPVSC